MTDGLSEEPGTGIFQTPSKEVEKKNKEDIVSRSRQENPEADNVTSTGEILADTAKSDLELSKQMLDTTKEQLVELKAIREALAPKIPKELTDLKSTPTSGTGDGEGGGGGGILGMLGMGGLGKGLMTAGKAVLPYALPAAAMIGTGAAVDYGLGKLGVGKDKEGNDLKIDTKQDDANWAKMSMGQKIQSGVGRGIEKVGSALFLDNMSREAQADRVKNETEYFKDKDFVDSSKEQDEANYKKMSFGKKILSSINRGGEKLSLFDSTKTTAARIRKETEELNKDAPGAVTKEALAPASVTTTKAASDPAPGAATKEALAAPIPTVKDDLESLQARRDKLAKQGPATDSPQSIKAHETLLGTLDKAIEDKKSKPREEKVTGGPGAKNPARPQRTEAGVAAFDKAYSEARSDGKSVQESKEIGNKARNTVDAAATPVVEQKSVDTAAPAGAATKEALAPTPATVKNQAQATVKSETTESKTSADIQVSDSEFRKKDPENFKKFVDFRDKRRDEIAKDLAKTYGSDKPSIDDMEEATVEAKLEANIKFKKEIEAVSAGKVETKTEEKVTGGLGVKNPAPDQAKLASLGQDINENPMLALRAGRPDLMPTSNSKIPVVEKKTISGTAARTIPQEKGILSKAADTAKSIGSSIAGFFGFGDKKKPVDTAAPGKAVAVTPKETVDGKPASVQPSGGDKFRDALSNAVGSAKQMVSNGEVDPKHLDEAVDQVMANVEGVSPQSANIIEKAVRAELQKGVKNPGERKSGEGAAVTPKETVDGKPAAAAKGATFDSNAASDKEFEAANADQDATEKYASNLDKIAMAEAKKGGRATPDISDRRAAQIIARREAIKTAGPGVTEGTLKGVEVTPEGVLKGGKISNTGKDVAKTSTENADMGREASKGGSNNTVVSNNVSSNNTTKFVPMKANPRPEYTGSSLDRYTNRITVY